jgi:hypothetical protein
MDCYWAFLQPGTAISHGMAEPTTNNIPTTPLSPLVNIGG